MQFYNLYITPLYNGNISLTQWKTRNTDSGLKTYNYTYDALNRIKTAINTNTKYNLDLVDYDKNGNITALKREGHTNAAATTFGMMDDLTYTYDAGNKLTKVEDIASLEGFKNGANTPIEYTYDQNGNMLTDANKGITNILYNHLNLPTTVTFVGTNKKIDYFYDAVGTKLKKVVTDASSLITTEYAGNYVYEAGVLQFFNTAEGYVEPKGLGWEYVYQYKDHPSTSLRAGFANKEEQDEFSLGWIDITARNYDPALGRWMNLDPLAELIRRHSPYNYAFDNPVYFIDADGLAPSFFDEESKRINEIDNNCNFRGKCGSKLDDGPVPDFIPEGFDDHKFKGGRTGDKWSQKTKKSPQRS